MKSKIVKALVAFLFVMLTACTVCFMSSCSRGGNNNKVINDNVTVTFVTNGGKEIAPITLKRGQNSRCRRRKKTEESLRTGIMTIVLRAFVQRK